jgi:hypothetical protein
MLLSNRLFTRREPTRDAKSLYIFCEGKKREFQYFRYFQGLDSRINLVIYPLKGDEDNSPTGLYDLAAQCLLKSGDNPDPQFELLAEDEVWFVIDTDTWGQKVEQLRVKCAGHKNWQLAQSNPCFEVWLYFHLFEEPANLQWADACHSWKEFLSAKIPGGFNSSKHPIYIAQAIDNAVKHYCVMENAPAIGSSEVHLLGRVIYSFCHKKIESVLNRI